MVVGRRGGRSLTVLGSRSGGLRSVVKLEVLAEKGVSCQPSKILFFGILRKGILGLKLGRDFISSPPIVYPQTTPLLIDSMNMFNAHFNAYCTNIH